MVARALAPTGCLFSLLLRGDLRLPLDLHAAPAARSEPVLLGEACHEQGLEARASCTRPLRIDGLLVPFCWDDLVRQLQVLKLFLRLLSSCLLLLSTIGLLGILFLLELPLLLVDLVHEGEQVNCALSWHRLARRSRELAGVLCLREVHHHEVIRILELILRPAAFGAISDRRVEHRILQLGSVYCVAFVQPAGAIGRPAS